MTQHRGQVFSYDLVFALMAVSFLLWYILNASNALAERVDYVEKENRMSEVAQSALDQLTETPGNPSDWRTLEAKSLGLAESRGVLDSGKVGQLVSLSSAPEGYDRVRAMLSMNRQGGAFLFNLKVIEAEGRESYSLGPKEPEGASVAASSRTMVMDRRIVRVVLKAWGIEWGAGG